MNLSRMAGHLIRRMNQRSTQVFALGMQDAGLDLTPVQFAALNAIRANPGSDQARIASLIAYDKATIGGVIDRLEKKGLIVREVSERDRRARVIRLSDDGSRLVEVASPLVEALQDEILAGLDETERETFLALARKAVLTMDDASS